MRKKGFFSLYLSIGGLRKGPGEFFMGVLISPEFFVSRIVGTLLNYRLNIST